MRLALVGPSWPLRGGIARTTTSLAQALAERGHLAAFLTPRRQYPRLLYPGGRDLDPAACARLDAAERCFAVLEPWSWPHLRRALRAARPDAVVLPYWTWAWAPLALRLAAWRQAPLLIVVHNPADHDASAGARRAGARVLAKAHGFLSHARPVAESLASRFPGVPLAVHPLPSDPRPAADRDGARASLGVPENATALLCFGLIRPYKGVDVLLEAFARLEPTLPVHLLLAGEPWGESGRAIRHALEAEHVRRRVTTALRWVPEEEAAAWFAAADVAVLPYRAATGSAVAAQALGAGLPLVASRVGGLADVVADGDNGLLVEAGDAGALAAALRRICDEGLRQRLAAGARRSAARWTWASYAEALEGVAAEVTPARPAASTTPPAR